MIGKETFNEENDLKIQFEGRNPWKIVMISWRPKWIHHILTEMWWICKLFAIKQKFLMVQEKSDHSQAAK